MWLQWLTLHCVRGDYHHHTMSQARRRHPTAQEARTGCRRALKTTGRSPSQERKSECSDRPALTEQGSNTGIVQAIKDVCFCQCSSSSNFISPTTSFQVIFPHNLFSVHPIYVMQKVKNLDNSNIFFVHWICLKTSTINVTARCCANWLWETSTYKNFDMPIFA